MIETTGVRPSWVLANNFGSSWVPCLRRRKHAWAVEWDMSKPA